VIAAANPLRGLAADAGAVGDQPSGGATTLPVPMIGWATIAAIRSGWVS
jgi:hypothetical protein